MDTIIDFREILKKRSEKEDYKRKENVPQIVYDEGRRIYGEYGVVEYIGEYKGEKVFSAGIVLPGGGLAPTGFPALLFYDGTNVRSTISPDNLTIYRELTSSSSSKNDQTSSCQ